MILPPGLGQLEPMLATGLVASIRPGAALLAAPMFGAPRVSPQLRLVIAIGIGLPMVSQLGMKISLDQLLALDGLLMIGGEILLGLSLGFALQLAVAACLLAGEVVSNAMGLGFATMNDPVGGHASPAIGQLLNIVALFLFFAMDGHLTLAAAIAESYRAMPPGGFGLAREPLQILLNFAGIVFSGGLAIALPVGFALILVQIVMGIIGRSAPSLNLFAVGLPATVLAGIVLLATALPALADTMRDMLIMGLATVNRLAAG